LVLVGGASLERLFLFLFTAGARGADLFRGGVFDMCVV
jgi:hypothetical protein